MGFDWRRIPTYANAGYIDRYPLGCSDPDQIAVISNDPRYEGMFQGSTKYHTFKAPDGWRGAIEL
jgi:hypothetical protein